MVARFSAGTKVRIREGAFLPLPSLDVWRHQSLTGEIMGSTSVVPYAVLIWEDDASQTIRVVQAYRVHLDVGIEVDSVTEDCLEAL
jgi:hypothetical protein